MKKVSTLLCFLFALSAFAAEPRIRWEKDGDYDLGYLAVPENRRSATSRTIEVAFLRLGSTAKQPGAPIVFLNGGPGQPATPAVQSPQWLRALTALRSVGDVILLDQRGIGKSRPLLDCNDKRPSPEESFTDSPKVIESRVAVLKQCALRFSAQGFDLTGYNTRESADDINDLRIALGAEKLNLMGFSYGTHLALAAIRQHGAHLSRVVLVGTEGPDHTWKLPATLDTQLAKIAPGEIAAFRRVLDRAAREPYTVRVTPRGGEEVVVRVGKRGLQQLLVWDIGDSRDFPSFPELIRQLDRNETELLTKFVAKRMGRVSSAGSLMGPLMDCASNVSAERRAIVQQQARTALFGNVMNVEEERLCAALPMRPLDDAFRSPVLSDVETLFVSGTMDSNTPPFQAEEVRWGFTRAKHHIIDKAGHEDLLTNADAFAAIVRFLGQ